MNSQVTTIRGLIDLMEKERELLVARNEVDPVCEPAGVNKAFEDGPAVMFENVKGYPGHRILINLFGRRQRVARIFNCATFGEIKHRVLEAVRNPILPVVVGDAPCQEIVVTDGIDINRMMPVTQSIEHDPGRIIGGGLTLFGDPDFGRCLAFRRMHFRGKDWASMALMAVGHVAPFIERHKRTRTKWPVTINITCPASLMMVGAAGITPLLVPQGSDEVGIAGALQGAPVEICRAKTQDAYVIADAEWVIEGYLDTSETVWESEEAEKEGAYASPLFVEYHGYVGFAHTTYKFVATAVTHKGDRPIYYGGTADLMDGQNRSAAFTEAQVLEMSNRVSPFLVQDVAALQGVHSHMAVVIKVKKRGPIDDRAAKDLLLLALSGMKTLKLVIVTDDDVNIESSDDLLWALATRVNPDQDIVSFHQHKESPDPQRAGAIGIDATLPFGWKRTWIRGTFPAVDLEKWFTGEQIAKVRAGQSEYARWIAENRR